jgi:hypothetical protein
MSEIYTANDLLRFIFNETSAEESIHIQHLLKHNLQAKEEYDGLNDMLAKVEESGLDPHPTSVQLILEHSAKSAKELI